VVRIARKFQARSIPEQRCLQENTWCESCGMSDLGMAQPDEYEEDGRVFLEGACAVCGNPIKTEIVDQRREES
jgi:hypothetical protein